MRAKKIEITPHTFIKVSKPKGWFPTIKLSYEHTKQSLYVTIQTKKQLRMLIKSLTKALNEDDWGEYAVD